MKSIFGIGRTFAVSTLALFCFSNAHAGVFEVGGSGSYRRQNIDRDAVDEAQSLTASVSYYLDEASAIELSYTDGKSRRSISPNVTNGHKTTVNYKALGLDFVYTIGGRESNIRPYIKLGAQYVLEKQIVDQYRTASGTWDAQIADDGQALVPSAGLGFKMGLTQALSLKAGIDAWSSRPLEESPFEIDYAGRVGLGWMF